MSERFTIPETISRQINTENNRRKINGPRVYSMYLPKTGLKLIGSIAPNWACAGVIYSQLFKHKQQHTAGFTENGPLYTSVYILLYNFTFKIYMYILFSMQMFARSTIIIRGIY